MKSKIIYTLSFILFAFASCTSMQTEMSKKWKLTESVNPMRDTLEAQMNREAQALRDSISKSKDTVAAKPFQQQLDNVQLGIDLFAGNLKKLLSDSYLELKEDGNYKSTITGDEEGRWEITGDKKFICLTPKGKNRIDTLQIKEFKRDVSLTLAFDSATYLSFSLEKN